MADLMKVSEFARQLTEIGKKYPNCVMDVCDRHLAISGPTHQGKTWYQSLIALHRPCSSGSLMARLEDGIKLANLRAERFAVKPDPAKAKAETTRKKAVKKKKAAFDKAEQDKRRAGQ